MDITFELVILDENGKYFDTVGEFDTLDYARKFRDKYLLTYPGVKYAIYKRVYEFVE